MINSVTTSTLGGTKHVSSQDYRCSSHAEINALKQLPYDKLKDKKFMSRIKIYVVRFNHAMLRNGHYKYENSKPCTECLLTLSSYGIKKVYYSMGDSESLIISKVNELLESGNHKYTSGKRKHKKKLR